MINFKTLKLRQQWSSGKLNPILTFVVLAVASMMTTKYNVVMVITSLFRPKDKKSVHCYWRGVDVRVSNLKNKEAQAIADWVNNLLIYDPENPHRMVALYGDATHKNHIHFQIHSNTQFR